MRPMRIHRGRGRGLRLLVLGLLAVAGLSGCGDDSGVVATTGTAGGPGSTATTAGEGTVPLEGSSSCSDPTGDTDQEIEGAEGWPDSFDLTGVEVAVEEGELVVTARFAGDVTQDSRVDLYLGDLSGFSWDGQSIELDWDYPSRQWAAFVGTMPGTEEVVLPVVTAEGNQLVGRIPLDRLPKLSAPFQWFAFVSLADFCPDGNLQGTAGNPVTFPG